MAKKKATIAVLEKDFEITSATVKDDLCSYTFDIKKGVGEGDTHTVKGKGLVDEDLLVAMRNFNVHLACIDDVFKHSGIEIGKIKAMENNELTALYHVTGFKIKGNGDNEAIVLVGTKSINCTGGRISIETPKIPLDKLSSYEWASELKEAADEARMEVELYKGGKCTPVEDSHSDSAQLTIAANMDIDLEASKVE